MSSTNSLNQRWLRTLPVLLVALSLSVSATTASAAGSGLLSRTPGRVAEHTHLWLARDGRGYRQEINEIVKIIGDAKHLNRSLRYRRHNLPVELTLNPVEIKLPDKKGILRNALAYAQLSQSGDSCQVHLNPSLRRLDARSQRVALVHEIFHCFQFGVTSHEIPDWILEGQAEWAGEDIVGPTFEVQNWWYDYLQNPGIPLFARTYDAIGFYAHLAERGINPWRVFDDMLRSTNNDGAFTAALAHGGPGATDAFLDTWASGYFRDKARGPAWDTTGVAIPPPGSFDAIPSKIKVSNGQKSDANPARPFTNGIAVLFGQADIVQADTTGHVRLSDDHYLDQVMPAHVDFCVRSGGCECPQGSTYQGPSLTPMATPAEVALTGGTEGAKASFTGVSLDAFCKKSPPVSNSTLPDPCMLLQRDEALALLGSIKTNYVFNTRDLRVCGYFLSSDLTGTPYIGVQVSVAQDYFVSNVDDNENNPRHGTAGTPVAGLGDEAYVGTLGDRTLTLWVRTGGVWLQVYLVWDGAPDDALGVATGIARIALARMK